MRELNQWPLVSALVDALPSGLIIRISAGPVVVWNTSAERITTIERRAVIDHDIDRLPATLRPFFDQQCTEFTLESEPPRYIEKIHRDIELDTLGNAEMVVFTDMTDIVLAREEMERYLLETSESRDMLEEQAADLTMALAEVEEKNQIIQGQNRRMIHELKMAGELQKSLLPDIYESYNGVSLATKYIPSMNIGGDLYDVVDLGQGNTGFIIADVSGHGVAAALVASMFKMSFHSLANTVASPKVLFHILNEDLKSILKEDYITAFYLLVDRYRRTITFSNAGHPTPLLFRRASALVEEIDTDGFFLGMFDDGDYAETTLDIEQGDAVLLYTDCLLETSDAAGDMFGKSRLKDLFTRVMTETHGQAAIDLIENEVRTFNASESFDDDFTVLLLEFTELAAGSPQVLEPTPPGMPSGDFEEF